MKKIIYALLVIVIITVIFLLSFKLGYDMGEKKSNTFTRINVSLSAFVQLLENREDQQKTDELVKYYLVNYLYDVISAYKLNYMPMQEHQIYDARAKVAKVVKFIEENNIDLFNLPAKPVIAEWLVDYVRDNIDEFSKNNKT